MKNLAPFSKAVLASFLFVCVVYAPCAVSQSAASSLDSSGKGKEDAKPQKSAGEMLKIVNDELIKEPGTFSYAVKGSVYNPSDKGIKNVVIKYHIWKKWMGKDGHGSIIKETGGLVFVTIKYIPPKQTLNFLATGDAPRMTEESGLVPDPIEAEISAEWDE